MQTKFRKHLGFLLLTTVWLLRPGFAISETAEACEALTAMDFGPEVTLFSAAVSSEIVAFGMAGPIVIPVPEYCDVRGMIAPEQGFDIKLPLATWNGRLYVVGNSVAAGMVQEDAMVPGILQGFATAGTDTGHQGDPLDWSFGYNPPDNSNPNAAEKVIDYCDESIHETTVLAKAVVDAFYGTGPAFSYYVGCSTGGRQGLIEAQRYPADFDGILVGAPIHYFSEITMRGVWEGNQAAAMGALIPAKLPLLAAAVMNRCDSIDGLVDGVIDNPLLCTFDARVDLPACDGDIDGIDCFTTAEREAIFAIYDGPRSSAGERLTFGEPFGSEAMAAEGSGWIPWLIWPGGPAASLAQLVGAGFQQFIGLEPPPGYVWDPSTFDFDTDWEQVTDKIGPLCDADDTNLSEFKALGGKLIHYDGWADPATGPYQTVDYYENVSDFMGAAEVDDFYKLYMIPGMFHCGGGLGCFNADALFASLVGWVEGGVEPSRYPGVRPEDGRTRPMCPYPEAARYLGTGSIEVAESFVCAEPVAARVDIIPTTVALSGLTKFLALITVPKGLELCEWERVAVVCEGALAENVVRVPKLFPHMPQMYIAQFDATALVNIAPSDETAFTVSAIFEKDGSAVSLEGTDTVRVAE